MYDELIRPSHRHSSKKIKIKNKSKYLPAQGVLAALMPREMSWSQEVQLQRGAVRTIFCHWKIVRLPETWTDIYTDWTMTRDTTDPAESEQSISHGGRAGSLCDYIIVIFPLSSSSTSHFLSQVSVVSGIGLAPNIPKYSTFDYNCNTALIIIFTIVSFYPFIL